MDTGENRNVQLEAEYVSLFGASVSHCVEELSVLSYLLVGNSKENDGAETFKQFRTAVDQVAMETKGVGCLSNMNDGANRLELVRLLCAGMKKSR